jgi:flagellar assembly protein FliH
MSGALLKAGEVGALRGGMSSLDLRDISRQAEEILAAARAEADQIAGQARKQLDAEREVVRQAAHRSGYEKGMAEGRETGRSAALEEARERFLKDQASLVSALTELLNTFSAQRERMYLAARRDVVVLAIAIARRITAKFEVMDEVAPDLAVQACEEALALVGEATKAVVHTHPDDWQAVESLTETLADSVQSRHIRVVRDASVGRGGVVLETGDSAVDAQVGLRVDRIADELVTDWRERLKRLSIEP